MLALCPMSKFISNSVMDSSSNGATARDTQERTDAKLGKTEAAKVVIHLWAGEEKLFFILCQATGANVAKWQFVLAQLDFQLPCANFKSMICLEALLCPSIMQTVASCLKSFANSDWKCIG